MYQTEYDNIRKQYGTIFNESVLPKDPSETVDEVLKNKTVLKIGVKHTKELKTELLKN